MRRRLKDVQMFSRSLLALTCAAASTALAFFVPTVVGVILCDFLCGPGPNDFNPYVMSGFFIGIACAVPVALIGLFYTLKPWFYPYVKMKDGHCRRCGYNLYGLNSALRTCPECGQANRKPE
jgi:hypothetical protein